MFCLKQMCSRNHNSKKKQFENITRNNIDIVGIIEYIANNEYDSIGLNVPFIMNDFHSMTFENVILYYKAKSSMMSCNRDNSNYIIELLISKNTRYEPKQGKYKRCIYCNKKKCDISLTCCDQFCHQSCELEAAENNENHTVCSKEDSSDCIPLVNNLEQDKCCVCFEPTNEQTKCKHAICRSCLDKIYCTHQSESKCPMCRKKLVSKDNIYTNTFSVTKQNYYTKTEETVEIKTSTIVNYF